MHVPYVVGEESHYNGTVSATNACHTYIKQTKQTNKQTNNLL